MNGLSLFILPNVSQAFTLRCRTLRGWRRYRMNIAASGGFPKRREPLLNIPMPIVAMALVFAAFQLASSLLGERFDLIAWNYLGFVPIRLSLTLFPDRLQDIIQQANSDP